ncbi:hypothetical protein [Edaphobacter modestus]|nr:hypothetical protein [Edaphobacter modestus]
MLLEDVYSDSLIHTLTGLQRQHIGIVLGVIVIARQKISYRG